MIDKEKLSIEELNDKIAASFIEIGKHLPTKYALQADSLRILIINYVKALIKAENKIRIRIINKGITFIIGFIIGGISMLFITVFFSCQPKGELAGLNCPCKVITAEITPRGHKVTYIDKDGKEQTVISKALYDQYNKRLNK